MEWRHGIYYIYCFLVLVDPADPTIYSIILQNISFLLSFPQLSFFRAYLASGPPAAKTLLHSLVNTFTYIFQVMLVYLYVMHMFGYFGPAESFIHSYPHYYCVLATPRPLVLSALLYLMYLACLKLLLVSQTEVFINLDHEATTTKLGITTVLLVIVNTVAELLYKGTTCNVKISMLISKTVLKVELEEGIFTPVKEEPFSFLIVFLITSIAIICYLVTFVIQLMRKYNNLTRKGIWQLFKQKSEEIPVNEIELDQIRSRPILMPIPELRGQHDTFCGISPVNRLGNPSGLDSSDIQISSIQTAIPQIIHVIPMQPSTSTTHFNEPSTLNTQIQEPLTYNTYFTEPSPSTKQFTEVEEDGTARGIIHSQPTGLVQLGASRLPAILPNLEEVSPPVAVPLVPSPPANLTWRKMIPVTEFSAVLVFLIICMIIILMDSKSSILTQVVHKGFEYVLKCLPMYWVLIIDDCYLKSMRITKAFLAERFQIFFD